MVNFRVVLELFFYFSGCLKFFMMVIDDTDDAVTSGREVLWDTVGLLEPACGWENRHVVVGWSPL